jgi:uncharacterized damage-inducible protein DinB
MLQETLRHLFNRDLNRLKTEIELYSDERSVWMIDGQIANSAGNLCLHLIGNLNTYIGAQLGGTGYVRHRDLEFSQKDIPIENLIGRIEETISVVDTTLSQLSDEQLAAEYPVLVFESKTSTEFFLIHLATHLTYHLGQINYHRRLLTK